MQYIKEIRIDTRSLFQPFIEKDIYIGKDDYLARIHALLEAGKEYSYLIIYADREHFSNLEYLTGYDPRFEESLLLLSQTGKKLLLVGDEGISYATRISFPLDTFLYPPFSLPGQPADASIHLEDIFARFGIGKNMAGKVGLVGWKNFTERDIPHPKKQFDLPYFILRPLLDLCGEAPLEAANHLFIDCTHGLRHHLDAKEIILAEYASSHSAENTMRVISQLRKGLSEMEAAAYLHIGGMPLATHPNVNFGENLFYAVASPTTTRKLQAGDLVGAGMAYRRSLCHRVGYYAETLQELPVEKQQSISLFYKKYFYALKTWYQNIRLGNTGGQVYKAMEDALGNIKNFGISLNLGHALHTEEWTDTPFFANSPHVLHSGILLQCDFTPVDPAQGIIAHAEDGVALADEALRHEIRALDPDCYNRICARQKMMQEHLGIDLPTEVLPLSDITGMLFPYLYDPSIVLAYCREGSS